jgi:hypothetical protein
MVVVGQRTWGELTQISEDTDLAVLYIFDPSCNRSKGSPCQQTEILFKAVHHMHCSPCCQPQSATIRGVWRMCVSTVLTRSPMNRWPATAGLFGASNSIGWLGTVA